MSNRENNLTINVPKEFEDCYKLNPYMKFESTDEHIIITNPWLDTTINLRVSKKDDNIISSLNSLMLPPVFSAIYHVSDQSFEFIYTFLPEDNQYWKREFEFTWQGAILKCKYSKSSKALLNIASAARLIGAESESNYRNLRKFYDYTNLTKKVDYIRKYFENKKPISFYVGPVTPPTEDYILDFARHVNFYMSYYDRRSPQIITHRVQEDFPQRDEKELFPIEFPNHIVGSKLDAYMLDLWAGATTASGRLRFLYFYQILEYAAFYYLDEQVKKRVLRLLKRPDLMHALDTSLPLILEEIVEFRQTDEYKISSVIQRTVDPQKIWTVIEKDIDLLSKEQRFEGGYCVAPVVRDGWSAEDFEKAWIPKIPDLLRKIRNALVHSRESRLGQFIAPTKMNNKLLAPWVRRIEEVAYEVMIYREI